MKKMEKYIIPVYAFCFIFIAVSVFVGIIFSNEKPMNNFKDKCVPLKDGWHISQNEETELKLPAVIDCDGKPYTLSVVLPENEFGWSRLPHLLIETYYADMKVFLDDKIIYDYNTPTNSSYRKTGTLLFLVTLPSDWEGKELSIKMTPNIDQSIMRVFKAPLIGPSASIIKSIIDKDVLSLLLAVALVVLGVILISMRFAMSLKLAKKWHTKATDDNNLLWLSFLSIAMGAYLLPQLDIARLLSKQGYSLQVIRFLSLPCMVIPGLMITLSSVDPKYEKCIIVSAIANLINLAAQLALNIAFNIDFVIMLNFTHVVLFIGLFIIIFTLLRTDGKLYPAKKTGAATMLPISAAGMYEVLIYHLYPQAARAAALKYGLVIFLAINSVVFIKNYIEFYDESVKSVLYRELAYSDIMTGLKNRQAYELSVENFKNGNVLFNTLQVFFLDLNNLKLLNDTMGHSWGDRLIKKMSQSLKNALKDVDTIYRTGGDEFVVMLKDNIVSNEWLCKKILAEAEGIDPEIDLSFAIGNAVAYTNDATEDAIAKADKNMYENKVLSKKAAGKPKFLKAAEEGEKI